MYRSGRKIMRFPLWRSSMGRFVDRTGQKFGKLTVLARDGTNALKKVIWRCRCDCGAEINVVSGALVTGNTTSCGCWFVERVTKHGGSGKGSYNTWRGMMRRCYNQKDKDYYKYGSVGITVYEKWHEYTVFAKDVGEPVGDQTLDRIDPHGNYTPENCRWASLTVQNRNVRMSKRNKSGTKGVLQIGNRWVAQITAKSVTYRSKAFDTKEQAAQERFSMEKQYWS
jgi:hypothetical protein